MCKLWEAYRTNDLAFSVEIAKKRRIRWMEWGSEVRKALKPTQPRPYPAEPQGPHAGLW